MRAATLPSRTVLACREPQATCLARTLAVHGLQPMVATPDAAWDRMAEGEGDVLLLDTGWPRFNAMAYAQAAVSRFGLPVLLLAHQADPAERVLALELAADDVVDADCPAREIVARLRAVLRRRHGRPSGEPGHAPAALPRFAGWTLDPMTRRLTAPDGAGVALTNGEFLLLAEFLGAPRCVLGRAQLSARVQGRGAEAGSDRAIDLLVSRLRHKLGDDPRAPALIKTVRGGGYRFDAADQPLTPWRVAAA